MLSKVESIGYTVGINTVLKIHFRMDFLLKMQRSVFVMQFALLLYGSWVMAGLSNVPNEDHCRILHFIPPIRGHALKDHLIKNLSLEKPGSCQTSCYLESDCVSYNLGPLKDGRHVCELSNSTTNDDHDLVPREGFIYRETENPCSKNPCSFDQKCQNGYTDKGYRCTCPDDSVNRTSIGEKWEKVNTCPVCFGARSDTPGPFTIRKTGFIARFKLVHRSGKVKCVSSPSSESNWGCPIRNFGDKQLSTLITHANKTHLLPAEDLLRMGASCGSKYTYALDGVDVNDEELVFPALSSPVHVSRDQEFLIWYGQDLADCSEHNNSGESCVDVYAWYN